MLTTLQIHLKPDDKQKVNYNYGSLLHGALMQQVEPHYAEFLHTNNLKPYSQYVYYDKEAQSFIWEISTINKDAKQNLLDKLTVNLNGKVHIEHKNLDLVITKKVINESISYNDLSREYFLEKDYKRIVNINFNTPASFKSFGKYVIFPDISLIYNNLLNKWNAYASEVSLKDENILEHLTQHTEMIGYNLRSTKFYLDNTKINCFKGEICLKVNGPESLVRIANLLFAFGEYSGVGVKCALGMGGIKVNN